MEKQSYVEKLSKYLIYLGILAIIGIVCWYFSSMLFDYLKGAVTDFNITGIIGSVGSVVINFAVGLFAVVFISFFFVKDENLFSKIVAALVPDHLEVSVTESISDI